jgi:hypothetical protein
MKWDVFILLPESLMRGGDGTKYSHIHSVDAEKRCYAVHKAKSFVSRLKKRDDRYCNVSMDDVYVIPSDRETRTGRYEIDSCCSSIKYIKD